MSDPVKCPKGMCPIPAGKFKMGSTNGDPDERPVRKVELSAYAMNKHPVTVGEYKTYLIEKEGARNQFQVVIRGCRDKSQLKVLGRAKNASEVTRLLPKVDGKRVCEAKIEPIHASMPELPKGFDGDDQPMVMMDWYAARAYCQFYGMDLPTEAQWERGARGLAGNKEYGTASGKLSKKEAHYHADATAPVCSKSENDLGLCDMSGNVWEWTLDWYQKDAYKSMAPKNPKGPADGKYKVVRGGSWGSHDLRDLRAAFRFGALPGFRFKIFGFRCVSAPKESKK